MRGLGKRAGRGAGFVVVGATSTSAERMVRRVRGDQHREEVARLRAPGVLLGEKPGAVLRDRFGLDALRAGYAGYRRNGAS
ncbi:MAG: hypothetical protein AVDCRST_MAG19-1102 [uncultured Thermomicrobiales bacterium]|uniref:Uncharacterized protein n=1 Tax=uncultured Thermomicrobiales bacterium TaxID=1645740 RepID=A0A6J4ULP3_9BACT|nr:MAG: hypothetical protein AVDCRST_MAG19-1102 [uncultured Thermomicrobiales bacterium]